MNEAALSATQQRPEPKEAFPYKPPTQEIRDKYPHIFALQKPLPTRLPKQVFDKLVAGFLLLVASPFLLLLKAAYLIEGWIIPENKGPMFFSYNAMSAGKVFPKYKIRLIKTKYIDPVGAAKGDWYAFSAEWTPDSRTHVGHFAKKFYMDELPQFYSILIGDMSLIGPRPLAVHHYERDRAQGNVTRFLIKGGLLGLGHVHKGTPEMGNPIYEYEYIDRYMNSSAFGLLWLDLVIIGRGIKVILQGKGL
ncbi:MAG: sugar transferase [Acidobacteria bacterium]|nr:sugar transferase [Acidobacteriota bacterium]MBI3488959.1 sugar transferase [Acidobacteriota bacterium]